MNTKHEAREPRSQNHTATLFPGGHAFPLEREDGWRTAAAHGLEQLTPLIKDKVQNCKCKVWEIYVNFHLKKKKKHTVNNSKLWDWRSIHQGLSCKGTKWGFAHPPPFCLHHPRCSSTPCGREGMVAHVIPRIRTIALKQKLNLFGKVPLWL